MASIVKAANRYRVYIWVKNTRDSTVFKTRREAEAWGARRETELRDARSPEDKHTLADALVRYRDEVSPTKRGERREKVWIEAFLRSFPVDQPLSKITPAVLAEWRGRRLTQVSAATVLALRSGMRAGELCSLRWDNVYEGYCHLPVTKTVPRDVPLTPKAERLVQKMRRWDTTSVFSLSSATLDTMFRRFRVRAGLSGFTFHDSRHTAATWISGRMRSNNLPAQQAVFDLCKMFGWSNVSQALTYYNPTAAEIAKRIA
jgi:integrase